MIYSILATLVTILALVIVGLSLRLLVRRGWLLGWLRGMGGLMLVAAGLLLVLTAFDLYSYRQVVEEQPLATISFARQESQRYSATLVDNDGEEEVFELAGDQWQLDARLLKWPNALAAMGIKPGYRLERISGRYYSLDQERNGPRTVYSLHDENSAVDVWAFFREYGDTVKVLDAAYGSATYVPMADGALYEVALSSSGLLARPLNEPARQAVERWE